MELLRTFLWLFGEVSGKALYWARLFPNTLEFDFWILCTEVSEKENSHKNIWFFLCVCLIWVTLADCKRTHLRNESWFLRSTFQIAESLHVHRNLGKWIWSNCLQLFAASRKDSHVKSSQTHFFLPKFVNGKVYWKLKSVL